MNFITGKTYSVSSVCDHNCVWEYKLEKRTEKSVWLTPLNGHQKADGTIRRTIKKYNGEEMVYPMGHYSMCPVLSAG